MGIEFGTHVKGVLLSHDTFDEWINREKKLEADLARVTAENERLREAAYGGNALRGNADLLEELAAIAEKHGESVPGVGDMVRAAKYRAGLLRAALEADSDG